jgi:hypothetical protein
LLGLPSVADLSAGALPSVAALIPDHDRVVGTPTEVYTHVARGVLTCWFGADGPLKSSHIYHADAEPPSRGGHSEIEIFAKDVSAEDPRALRAFRVVIATVDGSTKLEVENLKIPEPLASRLDRDVHRWAADGEGCGDGPVTAGWSAEEVRAGKPAKKGAQPTSGK